MEKKKRKRKEKIQKKLQNKSKYKNNKCFSRVTAVSVLSHAGNHSPPYLPKMPSNTVLIPGPVLGAACILIWSLPPMSTGIRTSAFFFLWELSISFYIFHRHRVCLVDHVDLICSLYSCWEGFGSSSSATLPLGFNCGFISTSAFGSSTEVSS